MYSLMKSLMVYSVTGQCCDIILEELYALKVQIIILMNKELWLNDISITENQSNEKDTPQETSVTKYRFLYAKSNNQLIPNKFYYDNEGFSSNIIYFSIQIFLLSDNDNLISLTDLYYDLCKLKLISDTCKLLFDVTEREQQEFSRVIEVVRELARIVLSRAQCSEKDFDHEKEVFVGDFGKLYKANQSCRYNKEFEKEVFIADGGFGEVYKTRHRLDGKDYAIKKITAEHITKWQLNETIKDFEKCYTDESSSDVTSFQNNDINDRFEKLDLSTNNMEKNVQENTTEESSSDIVSFRNSKSNENADQEVVETSTDNSSSCEESNREVNIDTSDKNKPYTLNIQMALCEQTLEQWCDKMSAIPEPITKAILEQIVCGVDYIHSQKIIHHDIKPSNIFISASGQLRVQLGDFGLACWLRKEHHSARGTRMYAAPEQMQGKCNPKSDIYSIGVVFIKLSIKTEMELAKIIESLKFGEVPETLKQHKWLQIIQRLIQQDPTNRPSASQLLQDFNHDKNVTIKRLEDTIVHLENNNNNKKDDIIQNLLQENVLLKEKNQELSRTMQQSKLVHEN